MAKCCGCWSDSSTVDTVHSGYLPALKQHEALKQSYKSSRERVARYPARLATLLLAKRAQPPCQTESAGRRGSRTARPVPQHSLTTALSAYLARKPIWFQRSNFQRTTPLRAPTSHLDQCHSSIYARFCQREGEGARSWANL